MGAIRFKVNGKEAEVRVGAGTPLLWVLRDEMGLTGTKYGCGAGQCGCCTVLLDGEAVRSCLTKMGSVAGRSVVTIEGLSENGGRALQKAWIALDVPQCGYCQPGQLVAAAALLAKKPNPGDADIDSAMSGVLCRCGTYSRIRAAIHLAAKEASDGHRRKG